MPILEYQCEKCRKSFEYFSRSSKDKVKECPHCHGKKLTKKLSVFSASAGSSSDAMCESGGGGCGSCSGEPGSCMSQMN